MSASEFVGIDVNYYWRIQVNLPYTTNLPADVMQNTWAFVGDGPTDYTLAIGWLGAFYDDVAPVLSPRISRVADAASMKVYNLALPRPNPPIAEYDYTVPALGAGLLALPPEVALVGSFEGPTVSGQVQRRRRGRVYIGPLAAGDTDTTYERPTAPLCTILKDALEALHTSSEASSLCRWAVFSPTNAGGWMIPGQSGPPNLPASVTPINNGWVDNEWDTQRRRSLEATTRYTFS